MDKLNFKYDFNGELREFDSDSKDFKGAIKIAINELEKLQKLKGHIFGSTLSPYNAENFQDDMKIYLACDVAKRTLKNIIGENPE